MTTLSKWLTLNAATKSATAIKKGIKNLPSPRAKRALINIGTKVYDPLCERFGLVFVSSGFRSPPLNRLIGGSSNSQHPLGEALDLDADGSGINNADIFHFILENLPFDQLIWEFGDDRQPAWVHVSLKLNGLNRKQVLRAIKENGKTKYIKYENA